MLDEGVPDLRTAAVDDVDDPRWDTRLDQQLDEALAERRRVRGRLEDDRVAADERGQHLPARDRDRKSTRLNSSHLGISYAVFCLKKKKKRIKEDNMRK